MSRKLPVVLGLCMVGAWAVQANAQGPCTGLTVTLEVAPVSASATGGGTVLVEAFVTNAGPDCLIRGAQIDLPCDLPGKPGSAGSMRAQPAVACAAAADCPASVTAGGNVVCAAGVCNSLSVGNTSHASSGAVPWIYAAVAPNDAATGCGGVGCTGGLRPIAQAACRLAGSPAAGEPSYILPGVGNADRPSGKSYIGSFRYEISECAAGTFNIPYDVMNMPCLNTDLTRLVADDNTCINSMFVAGAYTVDTGTCCDGTSCLCDNVNSFCCANAGAADRPAQCGAAASFNTSGTMCGLPADCACTNDGQCDDGQFCNGQETCNLGTGQCVAGTAPSCPGTTACANGVCDPAAAGGAGACVVVNKAAGFACGSAGNTDCDNPDTCDGNGNCASNNEPNGTACGSPADTDCDNADTCVGGSCQSNNEANGTACTDDGNACTDDRCQAGNCIHPNDDTNACSDGLNCTDNDRCVAGACVVDPRDCSDGLVCTLDACDEASGGCVNTDIGTIPCVDDTDCPGVPCGGQFCECVENPDCLLQPHKDANDANCHDEGDTVIVDFFFGGTPSTLCIAGGSVRIEYDPTCLDFTSADPGDAPWTNEIFEQVNEAAGVIFYAVGSPVGGPGPKCTSDAGVMARFTFTKIGTCNSCDLCLTTVNPQHTRLTTQKGQEVECAELGCSKPIFDDGDITSNCPGNIDVNSDCLSTTADVTWPAITFTDECDGVLDHNCVCSGPMPCDHLAESGGTLPQGTYTFTCSATDENCNEVSTCSWTVDVSDQQTLDVHLQLSPVVENDEFVRCICFELISSCTPLVVEEVCQDITFGGPFNFPGQGGDDVKVPKGKYVCLQARDRQHSLRATHFPLVCDGVAYTAEFKGDPFFGGNWLIQGNLNRDPLVDILDFGVFLGQFNQNPNPPKDKHCDDNGGDGFTHADFNGDGVVDIEDYTFIQINFLANDKDDCCHDPSASEPVGRTEVTVKQLREMGLESLVIADLNGDGLVNTDDMAAFVQGARPKADKVNRGSVGRPTTIRGSK